MYSESFEPIVKIRENIRLLPDDHPKHGYYTVEYIEPLRSITYDFGSIAPETEGSDTEIENLYMPDGEMAQYRYVLLEDFTLKIKQPLTKTRYATDVVVTTVSKMDQSVPLGNKVPRNELFVIEDEKVYFVPLNPTKYPRYRARIKFEGYRYVIRPIPKPDKWTDITVGGR
jgi:hypothetical protein